MSDSNVISLTGHHATPDEHCRKCDEVRRARTHLNAIGRPCSFCAGTGRDFLGRPCPHADPLDHTDGTTGQ